MSSTTENVENENYPGTPLAVFIVRWFIMTLIVGALTYTISRSILYNTISSSYPKFKLDSFKNVFFDISDSRLAADWAISLRSSNISNSTVPVFSEQRAELFYRNIKLATIEGCADYNREYKNTVINFQINSEVMKLDLVKNSTHKHLLEDWQHGQINFWAKISARFRYKRCGFYVRHIKVSIYCMNLTLDYMIDESGKPTDGSGVSYEEDEGYTDCYVVHES